MDRITPAERSRNMSRIRGSETAPELLVRSFLHRLGFRFRKNARGLPGKPDVVLSRFHTVVFVHGCFWHRHKNCRMASMPKSNVAFWKTKFSTNQDHDRRVIHQLRKSGWRILTVWECEAASDKVLRKALSPLIRSRNARLKMEGRAS